MKEIPNVQFTPGDSTKSLLQLALNVAPAGGLDFKAIRERNRVADAIENVGAGDLIKLEDADYDTAVESIKAIRWPHAQKHLIQFAKQFGL